MSAVLLWPAQTVFAGTYWEQVGGNGLGDPDNVVVSSLDVWNGQIYAAVGNYVVGCRIYRSADGNNWIKVNTDGFENAGLQVIMDLKAFGGQLYASTADDLPIPVQTAEIWHSTDGVTWTQSGADGLGNANNRRFYEMEEFNGQLYVGSFNTTDGAGIYRTADGTNWNLVLASAGGFGDANNTSIWGLYSFGGWLWAGTQNNFGAQIWRSNDGTNWNQYEDYAATPTYKAVNHFFEFGSRLYWFIINADEGAIMVRRNDDVFHELYVGGWGDANNIWYSMNTVVSGGLYYGTRNDITGGELWYYTGGTNFTQIGLDGFGNVDNFAIYALTFKDYLYIGLSTVNGLKGAEIWRRRSSANIVIITKSLNQGTFGQDYSSNLEVAGGKSPYSWKLFSGQLPKGLSINSQTGEIMGVPQETGDFSIKVSVTDNSRPQNGAYKSFTLKIVAGASDMGGVTILPETGADF